MIVLDTRRATARRMPGVRRIRAEREQLRFAQRRPLCDENSGAGLWLRIKS